MSPRAAPKDELTALRQEVAALRESDRWHRVLVRHFPNGAVHLFDRELRYLVSDGEVLYRLGLPPEKLLGKTIRDILPPAAAAIVARHLELALAGQANRYRAELGGILFDVYVVPVRDADGTIRTAMAMSQDVTEQARLDAQVQHLHQLEALAHRLVRLFCWEWDLRQESITVTAGPPEHADIPFAPLVLTAAELPQRFHPDDRPLIAAALAAARTRRVPICGRFRIVRPDHEVRVVQCVSDFVPGQPEVLAGAVLDITDQVRAEEARLASERQLEHQRLALIQHDRLRVLGEMSAGLAHELNQPLSGVRALAEHLLLANRRGWAAAAGTVEQRLTTILQQVDRMHHIVDHVRRFAVGAEQSTLVPCHIAALLRDSHETLAAPLSAAHCDLVLELAEGLPDVATNPYAVQQILLNFITNARDAQLDGAGGAGRLPPIRLSARYEPGGPAAAVCLAVTDSGPGMAPDVLARACEPFFTTKAPGLGTGLGLAICRHLAEQLGATIELRSAPGQGTTASLLLPVGPVAGGPTRPSRPWPIQPELPLP
jgi:signal transduction histidine kinase